MSSTQWTFHTQLRGRGVRLTGAAKGRRRAGAFADASCPPPPARVLRNCGRRRTLDVQVVLPRDINNVVSLVRLDRLEDLARALLESELDPAHRRPVQREVLGSETRESLRGSRRTLRRPLVAPCRRGPVLEGKNNGHLVGRRSREARSSSGPSFRRLGLTGARVERPR